MPTALCLGKPIPTMVTARVCRATTKEGPLNGIMLQLKQMGFPEMYERALVGPLFGPWAEDMVEGADISDGDRVLDVACGTGIVARLARQRAGQRGKVVGVDVNPAMLAVARGSSSGIDWRVGSADALPVSDEESFDVVTCQHGIQFFPDRPAAVREMRRVLAPGSRLTLSAWRSDEEMPFLRGLRRIAEQRVGEIRDRRHSLGETSQLEALLAEAGFRAIRVRPVSKTIHFQDGSVFVALNAMALVGMSETGRQLDEMERERTVGEVIADSREVLQSHSGDDGLRFEIGANIATARI